ncbi:MAG: T9SS type A sorting domain-containing protein [Bacteroidales bacterium]|jgi:hypothetical protein|nr:T9SS type A sorting domain-containing protein [Bacteroidales bacterium]MCK9499727.1 T9SS type A sorting domain-containing protein [Bacteroidales bacterium]MDY0314414.1 T9SS type A sorting domain-containing protein [Bacteroidales bacterium]NLB85728.1 T9SS type A sorting domain-containing protein [Bacteroidales bacterium]
MKKLKLIIFLFFICTTTFSQAVFNKIIQDTTNQIVTGVVTLDTGFVFIAGTNNEELIRCFAFTYVNSNGNKEWKKIYSDSQNQLWEGWDDNLKSFNNKFYFVGGKVNLNSDEIGFNIYNFNNKFDIISQIEVFSNSLEKRAFHSLKTMDSSYYVTGQIYDYNNEKYRMLFLKADSLGNYLWHKNLGNYVYEYGSYLLETSAGTILIGGETWLTNISNAKWYLVNTDTAGNIIWEKYFGRNNYNNGYITCLYKSNDSNFIISGSYPVAKYGGGTGEYIWDACLRKIDTNGNLLWEKLYRNYSCYPDGTGITLSSSIKSIIQLENGDYIMIGSSYWYYSRHRGFTIRTDSEGNVKWHRYYYAVADNSRWQYFSSFKPTFDGGYIIAGYGDDYSNIGYDPPQQAWLVKTDSLGMDGLCNIESDELNFDFDIIEVPEGICMNDTIEVYVHIAGKSAPYTIEFSTGQIIDSIYYPPTFVPVEIGLIDINLEWGGEIYFEDTITEATLSNHEWGQCIVKPVEFYTPSTWGPQQLQITVTDAYGESKTITKEIFAIQCPSVNVSANVSYDVNIYPNPAKDKLFIDIPQNINPIYTEIYNSMGQLIKSNNVHTGLNVINVAELTSGIYIIKISTDIEKFSLNFEKE